MPLVAVRKRADPETEARGIDRRYNAGVRRAFIDHAEILAEGVGDADVLAAIGRGDAAGVLDALPWIAAERALQEGLQDALTLPLESRGRKVFAQDVVPLIKRVRKQDDEFSATNRFSAAWLSNHVAALVVNLGAESRAAVLTYLDAAFTAGLSVQVITAEITAVVGLAESAVGAFVKLRTTLLGQGLGEVAILRLALARGARSLLARAKLVARTEVTNAREQGALDAWRVGQDLGLVAPTAVKTWVYVANADCPVCRSLDGQVRKLDQSFSSGIAGPSLRPPEHPNCICALSFKTLTEAAFAKL